jgi:hypothetical protein
VGCSDGDGDDDVRGAAGLEAGSSGEVRLVVLRLPWPGRRYENMLDGAIEGAGLLLQRDLGRQRSGAGVAKTHAAAQRGHRLAETMPGPRVRC